MDNTPTALFDSYEADFKGLMESVKERLEGAGTGEQRKAAMRRVEKDLDDADEMITQMELEIQGMPQSIRPQYAGRVKASKTELGRWKATAKDVHQAAARDALLTRGGPGAATSTQYPSDDPYGTSDRTRLLAGTQSLEDSTHRLQNSQRVALETEDIGTDILRSLRVQREQIEHSREMLGNAEGNVDRSSKTLKGMVRTMYKQRIITGAICAILVIIIIFVIVRKLT
jgi:vesicle transport through interaction with t-SNAREs 1